MSDAVAVVDVEKSLPRKQKKWLAELRAWELSGMGLVEWCEANGAKIDVFVGHRRKLKLMGVQVVRPDSDVGNWRRGRRVDAGGCVSGTGSVDAEDGAGADRDVEEEARAEADGAVVEEDKAEEPVEAKPVDPFGVVKSKVEGGVWVGDPFARITGIDVLKRLVDEYMRDVEDKASDGRWSSSKAGKSRDGRDYGRTGAPYSVAGLAAWLGMSLKQYQILRSDERYEWAHEYLGWVEAKMEGRMVEGAMSGDYAGPAFDLVMKNRFGYSDKIDTMNKRMSINVKVVEVRDRKALEAYERGGVEGMTETVKRLGEGVEVVEVVLAGNGRGGEKVVDAVEQGCSAPDDAPVPAKTGKGCRGSQYVKKTEAKDG